MLRRTDMSSILSLYISCIVIHEKIVDNLIRRLHILIKHFIGKMYSKSFRIILSYILSIPTLHNKYYSIRTTFIHIQSIGLKRYLYKNTCSTENGFGFYDTHPNNSFLYTCAGFNCRWENCQRVFTKYFRYYIILIQYEGLKILNKYVTWE